MATRKTEKPQAARVDAKTRIRKIIPLLEKQYSNAEIALHYANPLELLVATILSAQCTDERVNTVTKSLFTKYTSAEDYAKADLKELESNLRSTGFYHDKAKNIKQCCRLLVDKHNSQVPQTMEELLDLPGVARKTANIVLQNAFGVIEGIAVDTHVRRTSRRLGLTENEDPGKIEQDLMRIVPKAKWARITDLLIFLGRHACDARKPECQTCVLNKLCPSAFTFSQKQSKKKQEPI